MSTYSLCIWMGCPSRYHVEQTLPCDRVLVSVMDFPISQVSPRFLRLTSLSLLLLCVVGCGCVLFLLFLFHVTPSKLWYI
jgi:hypothetical protein